MAGIYVHVPFCRSKCPYCDFYSITDLAPVSDYLTAIATEAQLPNLVPGSFDTLYIGGGTPSALSPGQLSSLLATMTTLLDSAQPEITFELNPADVSPELLTVLQQAGVNRLSLGVQSFHDFELEFLGRRHNQKEAWQAIDLIRKFDFADLSLDLIYGLPGSGTREWQTNLEMALAAKPKHLSCYNLTIAANTPFGHRQAEGRLVPPGEELLEHLFLGTCKLFEAAEFYHYEVSNFARTPKHTSRHNQNYWRRVPYLGLGPAAHSFDGNRRWWNFRDLNKYLRALDANQSPIENSEEINSEQARLETLALGMRTSRGVELAIIGDTPVVEQLINQGLVTKNQDRLIPTSRGFLMADGIAKLLC